MELKDLIGEHELSGVDFGTLPADNDAFRYEDSSTMSFVLDGRAYCVVEDPNDGYRSSMRDIFEVPVESVKNRFPPVRVLGIYVDKCEYGGSSDILQLVDVVTAKQILEVGTENEDDYYPSFVANFRPEDMAPNAVQATNPTD